MPHWAIAVLITVGVIVMIVFIRRKKARQEKARQELEDYRYKHYGRWKRYSIQQLEGEIHRIQGRKFELQERLKAFGLAGASRRESPISDDIESQMRDIRWQLEELDTQEDDIARVIRDKTQAHINRRLS